MRVRLRFTEHGPIRFLGHRDLARVFERAVRRAGLPVAYSEGFSPRPRFHFGLALSVGYESDAEYLDLDLREDVEVDVDALPTLLTALLPVGVDVVAAAPIGREVTALQAAVDVVVWHLDLEGTPVPLAHEAVATLLARPSVMVEIERKGERQVVDLRPAVRDLTVKSAGPTLTAVAELATRPRAIRPAELIAAFDPHLEVRLVTRHEQFMTVDGRLEPPLVVAGRCDPADRLAS